MAIPFFVVPQPTIRSAYLGPAKANTEIVYSGFIYFDPELTGSGAAWKLVTVEFDLPARVSGMAGSADFFPFGAVLDQNIAATAFPMLFSNDGQAVNAGWGVHIGASRTAAGHVRVSIDASVRDTDGKLARIGYHVTVLAQLAQDFLRDWLVHSLATSTWKFQNIVTSGLKASSASFSLASINKASIATADIKNASIDKASILEASITKLAAKNAEIGSLHALSATLDEATIARLSVPGKATIEQASIRDLLIASHVPDRRTVLYVRSTGLDSNDGSLAAPYRTVQRALRDVPLVLAGQRVFIDCTGIGTEDLADGFRFPAVHGPSGGYAVDEASAFDGQIGYESDVTIAAIPTVLDVVNAYAEAADPETGLVTLTDATKAWLPGEHKGRLAVGASIYEIAAILDNSATELELACDFALTAPIRIVEPSAELRVPSGSPLEIQALIGTLLLYGIKLSQPLQLEHATLFLECCSIQGWHQFSGFVEGFGIQCESGAVPGQRIRFDGGSALLQYVVLRDMTLDQHLGKWKLFGCGVDGCSALGQGSGSAVGHSSPEDLISPMHFDVEMTVIKNSSGNGLQFLGGYTAYARRVKILSAAQDAVLARGPGRLILDACAGSGSQGYGVRVLDGAQVTCEDPANQELGPCTVSGDQGDVKVGLLPVRSWDDLKTNFPTGNQLDYKGSGSRLAVHSVPIEAMP